MGEKIVFKEFLDNVESFSYEYIETYAYQESLLCRSELLLARRMMKILVNGLKNKYSPEDLVVKKDLLRELKCIYKGYVNKNVDRLSISEELILEDLMSFIKIHFMVENL